MPKSNDDAIRTLYRAVASLQNEDECRAFFDDICTVKEIDALARRLLVADALSRGENYVDINAHLGASTATIGRVSRCLRLGDGGYNTVLSRMKGATNND